MEVKNTIKNLADANNLAATMPTIDKCIQTYEDKETEIAKCKREEQQRKIEDLKSSKNEGNKTEEEKKEIDLKIEHTHDDIIRDEDERMQKSEKKQMVLYGLKIFAYTALTIFTVGAAADSISNLISHMNNNNQL